MNYEQQQIETLSKQVAELQLKASVAMEHLDRRIQTMEVQINENQVEYSYEDLEDYLASATFLNHYYGRKYDLSTVKVLLNAY